jgi:hypothetical protein
MIEESTRLKMAHIATKAKKTSYCSNRGGSTATQLYFYFLDGGNATRLLCIGACMADPGCWPVAGSLADLLQRM